LNRVKAAKEDQGKEYKPLPVPKKIEAALLSIFASPDFHDGVVEPFRALEKNEKKLPRTVLSAGQTEMLRALKAGQLDQRQIARFNKEILLRLLPKGILIKYHPATIATVPRPTHYHTPKAGSGYKLYQDSGRADGTVVGPFGLKTEKGIPILGAVMSDSLAWHLKKVGDDLWVATERGLTILNTTTGEARIVTDKDGLLHDRVIRVFHDGRKSMWVCTKGGINIMPLKWESGAK